MYDARKHNSEQRISVMLTPPQMYKYILSIVYKYLAAASSNYRAYSVLTSTYMDLYINSIFYI